MIPRRAAFVVAATLMLAACAGPKASPTPAPTPAPTPVVTAAPTPAPTQAASVPAVVCVGASTTYLDWLNSEFLPDTADPATPPADPSADLLAQIQAAGVIRVSTDKDYSPQSFLNPDGSWVGFDVDVAKELAERLGVTAEFQHVDWDLITAGNWAGRWDISVGSMTITTPRKEILSFTQPYYYTPAYLAASTRSGVTSLDQLPFAIPADVTATTLPTDANCIEQIAAGRPEFDLLITSGTVIDDAVANNQPIVKIGEPIYTEDLSVAIDKSGPPHQALLAELDRIVGEMHTDGTLTQLSNQWFHADLTQEPGG